MAPELSVIIVNHNGGSYVHDCLTSVEKERRGRNWEVLFVDNASLDGSADHVEGRFPGVLLVRLPENVGFAAANNLGFRRSEGHLVLFLNPDARLLPGSVDALLAEMAGHPRTGIVGPALLSGEDTFQVSFGGRVGFSREVFHKVLGNAYWRRRLKRDMKRKVTAWVSGACLLARRGALEEAGGFDQSFFLYFEDIDLCRRVGMAGREVVFLPAARVFHAGGASAAGAPTRSRLEYRRSQLTYYRKHSPALSRLLLRAYLRLTVLFGGLFGPRNAGSRSFRRDVSALLGSRGGGCS